LKDDTLFLIHIRECIARVENYVQSGREEFLARTLIQDAVLRNLQVLAESTQRLSDNLKARHPDVDWRRIAGFRNILVHDYLGVDVERVWDIVLTDLPDLKQAVEGMLGSE